MPDIGATLREARMRQRIDITEMEVQTKIRAKYLRALENEEWDLLPGSTYVKSFLRTYAEALGLDARALVEEYKLRHEGLETGELRPIRPATARERSSRREPRGGPPRGVLLGLVLVAVLAALFLIGRGGSDDDPDPAGVATVPRTETEREQPARTERERPSPPRSVRLTIAPSAPVWVCLEDARGRRLIPGEEIGEGARTYRSRRFRMTLGNANVTVRANGRRIAVPESSEPIGLAIDSRGRGRPLPEADRPTCGQ